MKRLVLALSLVLAFCGTLHAQVMPGERALHRVPLKTGVTGILQVPNGGTGASSETLNNLLLGNGTSAITSLGSLGTTTTVLHGNAGSFPSWSSIVSADLNITSTTCTNQFLTALSSAAAGTCTTATLAGAQFANQGTTTTVLHGNAAGNPSWAGVSLVNDAAANQGTTTTLLHGNAAGQPSFGSVVSNDLNITTTTCTNQFVTALSAAAAGTCTTDTLASAQHANQGTTTTLLHGNAAGNPSWTGVSLTADTTANQGSTTTVLHGNAAGQPSFAGVSLINDAAANQGTTTTVLHGNAAGQPSFGSIASGDLNITSTTCTNQFVTAISASAAGTCTTATLASAQFANQGTTTTLLHGNAAGNPSFAGVSLLNDTAANQGTTTTVLHGNAAGQPSFGAVALGTDISGQLPILNGGTSQTTALAARGSSGLDIEAGTGHGDSIYTVLATDRYVFTNAAFTASRAWTLPAANAVNAGGTICFGDQQGTLTGTNTLVITRGGTDTINGGTTYTLNSAFEGVCLVSDGSSKWTTTGIADQATANAIILGGGTSATKGVVGSLGTTTTLLHGNASGAPTFGSVVSGDLNITTTTCTNQFVTALSASAAGTCTTATLAGAQFANQGTTTQVLHGNGAGNPSWAGVSLVNDTAANQGTTTNVLHGNAAGQPSFGSVVSNDLNITTTTCTNQFVTAISAGGVGTCTTDTLASAQHANQGTTTTVLHGNAAGNPSFGSVAISTDVSGLGANVGPWLITPSLANLNTALGVTVKSAGTETIYIPATALTPNTTNGCAPGTVETATNKVMQKTCNFDPTTQQSAQFTVAMPKSWNNGTITAIFYWSHPSTSTNFGTVWNVACVYVPTNSAGDVAFGTAQNTATSTGGTTDNIYISAATAAATCAGSPASGGMTYFRVQRVPADAGDTLAVVARLVGVKINYTSNATNDN